MNLKKGSLVSRSVIAKCINKYIQDNKLQNVVEGKKKFVVLDDKLAKLFNQDIKTNPQLELANFFSIQKYLTPLIKV